jgi:hypothetical protein
MKNINSKKNKFFRKPCNISLKKKKYGGFTNSNSNNKHNKNTESEKEKNSNTFIPSQSERHDQIEKIKQQVKEERELKLPTFDSMVKNVDYDLGISEVVNKTKQIAASAALDSVDDVGKLIGVNIMKPKEIQAKLDNINQSIHDPETIEKVKDIAEGVAEIGGVLIESTKPFVEPMINNTIEAAGDAASKIGEAGVKVILNTAEEIPGVGVVIGTVRSISNIGEALVATANSGSEVVTDMADTVNASFKYFKELIKEKGDVVNRTVNSIKHFTNPKRFKSKIFHGGKTKNNKILKKKNIITKKVRFNL